MMDSLHRSSSDAASRVVETCGCVCRRQRRRGKGRASSRHVGLLLILLIIGGAPASGAALESVKTLDLAFRDGEAVAAFTTHGHIFRGADGAWSWVSGDVAPGEPRAFAVSGERVVVATSEGVFSGDVPGCELEPVTGIDKSLIVGGFAAGGGRLFAAAAADSGPSGLLVSHDDGATWEPVSDLWSDALDLEAVEIGHVRGWAFGREAEAPAMWTLDVEADRWISVPVAEVESPKFIGADDEVALLVEGNGSGYYLFAFPPSGAARAFGPSETEPVSADSWGEDILAVDPHGSLMFVRSEEVEAPRWTAHCVKNGGASLFLCLHRGTGYAFGSWEPLGGGWTGGVRWLDVEPAECPAGSRGASLAADGAWEAAREAGVATQAPPRDPRSLDGACATTAAGRGDLPALLVAFLFVVGARCRRQRVA